MFVCLCGSNRNQAPQHKIKFGWVLSIKDCLNHHAWKAKTALSQRIDCLARKKHRESTTDQAYRPTDSHATCNVAGTRLQYSKPCMRLKRQKWQRQSDRWIVLEARPVNTFLSAKLRGNSITWWQVDLQNVYIIGMIWTRRPTKGAFLRPFMKGGIWITSFHMSNI